jgi:hypothetical protein
MIRRTQSGGGSLLISLSTIALLSAVAGHYLLSIGMRSHTAARSASWHEASLAAESAADLAVAEIRRVLPEIKQLPSDPWTGWRTVRGVLDNVKVLSPGLELSYTPPPLYHEGEGNNTLIGTVSLDVPLNLEAPGGRQLFRIRSTGTTYVPGPLHSGHSRLDNRLRRLSLVRDPVTRLPVSRPSVSRTIELIVRPVLPFETALLSQGGIDLANSRAEMDSFNSLDPLKSNLGLYDSSRKQSNGSVYTNSADFIFGGKIYGNAGTNGGTLTPFSGNAPTGTDAERVITGKVTNNSHQYTPPVPAPNWATVAASPNDVSTPKRISGGSPASPTRYKLDQISSTLTISRGLLGVGTHAEIWVKGDITGVIVAEPGVYVTIYVEGNIRTSSANLQNLSKRAENLQIYGVQPPSGEVRNIEVSLIGTQNLSATDLYASVYAPGHNLKLTGDGHMMGSYIVKSATGGAKARFHYDEALALRIGKIVDYKVASWIEQIPGE